MASLPSSVYMSRNYINREQLRLCKDSPSDISFSQSVFTEVFYLYIFFLSFKSGSLLLFSLSTLYNILHNVCRSGPVFLFPQHGPGYGLATSQLVFCITENSNYWTPLVQGLALALWQFAILSDSSSLTSYGHGSSLFAFFPSLLILWWINCLV